jgi:vacuolar-type H+-ATPase subunit H
MGFLDSLSEAVSKTKEGGLPIDLSKLKEQAESEAKRIVEFAKKEAESEAKRIVDAAKKEAAEIIAKAKASIA